jgi:uncharacterized lipoprotein YddW (UPF0748 family)
MNPERNDFGLSAPQWAARLICFFIVILLLIPFQLSSVVLAGQKIPASGGASHQEKPENSEKSDAADTDAEVINNILGVPVVPEHNTPSGKANPPTSAPTIGPSTAGQPLASPQTPEGTAVPKKPFSFLDADAASVLAPEFDYGVYSMNMRILDGYRHKVTDALETGRQLALDMPKDKVDALLQEAQTHKRRFESLYLANQTQAGLNEFGLARKAMLQALALSTNSPKVEARAIWLDRSTIIDAGNPEGLRRLMQRLKRAGINIVYFETVNAGFPIYPSKILRNNPLVKGWDPLAVAVDEGHKLGIEVHAWVWVFAVGNRRHNRLIGMPDDYAGPVLQESGLMSEALRNREGGLSVDMRQNEFWLSPASPKARTFLMSVYKEIVSNYDVDGIHLDYIRYPFQTSGNRMGFEAVGRERFSQSTGHSLDTMDDATARLWVAWKTYQVNSFVQQVSETLRRLKPSLRISAAVFPMRRDARIVAIQQDWETWINNGWVDTLSPMSYTTDPERLQSLFEYVQNSPQKHSLIYPGIAMSRLDGGQLVMQLEALREKGSLGATLFAGAQLDAEKIEALGTGPFKQSGTLPPHRDALKSLQILLVDYQQKFEHLNATAVAVSGIAPEQATAIHSALSGFSSALNAIGAAKTIAEIPAPKLQALQQAFDALQNATTNWLMLDKPTHALRAEYFENKMLGLETLLGYVSDKSTMPSSGTAAAPDFSAASMSSLMPVTPPVTPASNTSAPSGIVSKTPVVPAAAASKAVETITSAPTVKNEPPKLNDTLVKDDTNVLDDSEDTDPADVTEGNPPAKAAKASSSAKSAPNNAAHSISKATTNKPTGLFHPTIPTKTAKVKASSKHTTSKSSGKSSHRKHKTH